VWIVTGSLRLKRFVAVTYFQVLAEYYMDGPKKPAKNLLFGEDSDQGFLEYKVRVISLHLEIQPEM
jgi:hypothetical protein